MTKIRLSKISGDRLISVLSSTKGMTKIKYADGYPMPVYPSTPTVGYPFGVYDDKTGSFKTSRVVQILSGDTFKTENSIYKWEEIN